MNKIRYFDNAATTFPKPEIVYKFMDGFYREYGVNVGRGQHKQAFIASKLVDETRDLLLELFHCDNKKKIVFTHTATEAINIILQGIDIPENANVYLSPFEHNAITRTLNYLSATKKLNVRILAVDGDLLSYDLVKINCQFEEYKPDVVIISHASNVCGIVAPITEIFERSKRYCAKNIVDMCQTAGLLDTDLGSDNIDFSIFAGHKTLYGPLGIAGFVCGNNIIPKPLIYGGTGHDSSNQNMPEDIPERYEAGSQNIMAIAGLNAAIKWIKEIGIENIYRKDIENRIKLEELFKQFKNIKIIGDSKLTQNIGVVSCVFDGYSSDDIGHILDENNIAVRTGLHCSPYAHKFLGTYPEGLVRFSVGYFNRDEDFEILKNILMHISENS